MGMIQIGSLSLIQLKGCGNIMEVYDVVKKLIGPIEPVGEANIDNIRFENLKEMCDLVEKLLSDIQYVVSFKDCSEFSRSNAGKKAEKFLKSIKDED
jgi:hypothetical protein